MATNPTLKLAPATPTPIGSSSYLAAATLVRLVGDFAQRQPEWAESIVYDTRPDERHDMTLVSQRVYGRRDEFLVVMAAAGLDSPEETLTERRLILPTERQLSDMKARAGIELVPWRRSAELRADPVLAR